MSTNLENIKKLISENIKEYPNFPKKGIIFYDLHPLMANPDARGKILDFLVEKYNNLDKKVTCIVAMESRGYYLGIPLADRLGVPFIPLRKPGKLPGKLESVSYGLEYGTDTLSVQKKVIKAGDNVLVVDDLLATGGTAAAACQLVQKCGGIIVEVSVIIELSFLNGRKKAPEGVEYYSLVQF